MSDPKPQPEPSMEEILATVRRIIADDESGAGPAAPPSAPSLAGDVLELTEALQADGSVRHLPPFGSQLRDIGAREAGERPLAPSPEDRIGPTPPVPGAPTEAGRPTERQPKLAAADEPREPEIAVAPLGLKPDDAAERAEPRLGAGERTLEDIVRDVLRPMVQKWLDENLPDLVEREVRAEIARTAREAVAAEQPSSSRRRTRRSIPD